MKSNTAYKVVRDRLARAHQIRGTPSGLDWDCFPSETGYRHALAMATKLTNEQFWSEHWEGAAGDVVANWGYYGRVWDRVYDKVFASGRQQDTCIEVGCANSQHLPRIATRFGVRVCGLDYTENGCRLAREHLATAGVNGTIYQRDLFDANQDLANQFDVVVSFGLVEHFEDTRQPLQAIQRLLKPGGRILTTTPNVNPTSLNVFVQRLVGPRILAAHKLMSLAQLREAHEACGFCTTHCGFEGMGLCLACDTPSAGNRLISGMAFRSVQSLRKGLELLGQSPPQTSLTGLLMVYTGQI